MSTTSKIEARQRARDSKAKADVTRLALDEKIEDAATEFYVASDKLEELRAQIEAAEDAVGVQVEKLFGLAQTADRVADLTGLSVAEVRTIRRRRQAGKKEPV